MIGGFQQRLLQDSVLHLVRWSIDALGWTDSGRRHLPIIVLAEPLKWNVPVEPNLIALYVEETIAQEMELGNDRATVDTHRMGLTVLAENEALGLHLAGDLQAVLRGQMPVIDRVRSSFEVLDFSQATPPVIGFATVDNVEITEPPSHRRREWLSHWYEIWFDVDFAYDPEEDPK